MIDISTLKNQLVDQGRLTEEQILQAEDYALTMKMSLDEAVLFLNMLDYASFGQSLSEIYEIPYHPLLEEPPSEAAKEKIPLKSAERQQIFPVDFDAKTSILTLAVHDPEDQTLVEKLRNIFPAPVRLNFTVASKPEICMAIDVHYKGKKYTPDLKLEVPEEFNIVSPENKVKTELDLEDAQQSEKKILLLEPELDRSRALATILRMEGFPDVKWVASPEEAANAIKAEPADLILANARTYKAQGSWIKEMSVKVELPLISYYNLKPMLLGQEYPYSQMSEALISLVSFMVRRGLENNEEQLQEIITRVRYCKVLALRLGMDPVQVDGTVLAAWLSDQGEFLLDQLTTPYRLEEVLKPGENSHCEKRVEASILSLVKKYQVLKKNNPEVTSNIDLVRKELEPQFHSPEDKSLLESFLHVIRDEEFLKDVDQSAGRILIVDPEFSLDSSMALRLANDGYEVTGVADAGKAAKVIVDSGTDLVVSEVNLPGTDGIQLCRVLRKNRDAAHIPFFFLTAEEGERLATECLEAGADDFLKKPVDLELLSLKIRHILSIKAPKEVKRGITGSLTDMSATDIIQSLTSGDKDVEVHLESMGEKGQIYIQNGEIIHSQAGDLDGEEGFYGLMAWQAGEFEIVACSTFPPRTIHSSTMSLLMEGARLADESGAVGEA